MDTNVDTIQVIRTVEDHPPTAGKKITFTIHHKGKTHSLPILLQLDSTFDPVKAIDKMIAAARDAFAGITGHSPDTFLFPS